MKKAVALMIAAIFVATIIPAFAQETMGDKTMTEQTNQVNAMTNMVSATQDEGMLKAAEEKAESAVEEAQEEAGAAQVK